MILEHERIADDFHSCKMLGLADNDLAYANRTDLANCFTKQRVRLLAALLWKEVVRGLEVTGIDLVLLHKIENVYRLRLLQCSSLEVLVGDDDEFSLLVLVALHDLVPRDGFSVSLTHALILDRREIVFVQQPEADMIGTHSSSELDGDVDEAECQ